MFKHLSIKTKLAAPWHHIALSLAALAVSLFGGHKISSRTDTFR